MSGRTVKIFLVDGYRNYWFDNVEQVIEEIDMPINPSVAN
jgi:hypothetical protein